MAGAAPQGDRRTVRTDSGVWDGAHRSLTTGLLLAVSITAFEALAVATVLPAIAEDLGGVGAWYGWVFSAFMLANLVGVAVAGILADRGSPTLPFVAGCVVFSAGLAMAGLAASVSWLLAGRIAQGLGAGALSSIAYVAVARGYPGADQPRMLALLASAWVVPALSGPAAAAVVESALGWRAVFLLLVPVTAVAGVLATKGVAALAPSPAAESPPGRLAASLRLAGGAALVLFAAEGAGPAASSSPWAVATGLSIPILAAAIGVWIAVPALSRLLPEGTLRATPGPGAALVVKGLVTFAFFGVEAFLPLTLTSVRGEPVMAGGVALTAGTLAWTAGTWAQERLAGRVPRLSLLHIGTASSILAILGAGSVLVAPDPALVAALSWALAGFGIGLVYPTTTLTVLDGVRGGRAGEAASALQLVGVLGTALGPGVAGAVCGLILGVGGGTAAGIAGAFLVMLTASVAAAALGRRCDPVNLPMEPPATAGGLDPIEESA